MAERATQPMYFWTCSQCGAEQAMTKEANHIYRQNHGTFHCVHGHTQWYPNGPTEAEKIQKQFEAERLARQRAEQRIAEWQDETRIAKERAERERNRANGYKGHATRMTKRAKAGVCPCCNRTFKQLASHMANKHPEFTPIALKEGVSLQ